MGDKLIMKKKIPFWMMPASWGLTGKSRAIAEAEYYFEGDALEEKLLEINTPDPDELAVAKLAHQLKKEKITQEQHDKEVARIRKEPWVNVVKMGINPTNVSAGFFELDWNDEFVIMLQENGYTGTSDEEIVNKWFNNVCRTVLIQEQADQDYGLQEQQFKPDVINVKKSKGKRTPKAE